MDLIATLKSMFENRGSDIVLKVGVPPSVRIDGKMVTLGSDIVTPEFADQVIDQICNDAQKKKLKMREVDLAFEVEGIGRFRANIFRQRGDYSIVMRHITNDILSFKDLHLPPEGMSKIANLERGLVLVTGITGSGKSTTLASVIEHINQTTAKHIVTIEDPIEYTYEDKNSIINQREVGTDSQSYGSALKYVVRQNPDIILIGELRDEETMESAFNAAETGHLVFSTLHTVNCMQTVDRMISFFPPHLHTWVREQIALLLQAVVSQRLVRRSDGPGRVPVVELMLQTPHIRDLLAEGKFADLYKAIKEDEYYGNQTFNQSIKGFIDQGLISEEDGLKAADDPDELKLSLRGIVKGTKSTDFYSKT